MEAEEKKTQLEKVTLIRLSSSYRSKFSQHPDLNSFIGKPLRVVGEVETKAGPAYRFRDSKGNESQILKMFAVPIK